MSLADDIKASLKTAMSGRDQARVEALRLLIAAIKNKEIEKKGALADDETISLLKTEAKKRQEAWEIYQRAKRDELAQKEAFELQLIKEFLPKQLDQEKVEAMVKEMKESGELPLNFGEAMRLVMARLKGQADGRVVAEAVKAVL